MPKRAATSKGASQNRKSLERPAERTTRSPTPTLSFHDYDSDVASDDDETLCEKEALAVALAKTRRSLEEKERASANKRKSGNKYTFRGKIVKWNDGECKGGFFDELLGSPYGTGAMGLGERALMLVQIAPENPTVDIVFVHGLAGSPSASFSWHNGKGKDTVLTSAFPFVGKRIEKATEFHHWPSDSIASTFPDARVLSFDYQADLQKAWGPDSARSQVSIESLALSLLKQLRYKRSCKALQNPVIFVTHGLGDVVVKDALLISRSERYRTSRENAAEVFDSTIGIVNMGTSLKQLSDAETVGALMGRAGVRNVSGEKLQRFMGSLEESRDAKRQEVFDNVAAVESWVLHSFVASNSSFDPPAVKTDPKKRARDVKEVIRELDGTFFTLAKLHPEDQNLRLVMDAIGDIMDSSPRATLKRILQPLETRDERLRNGIARLFQKMDSAMWMASSSSTSALKAVVLLLRKRKLLVEAETCSRILVSATRVVQLRLRNAKGGNEGDEDDGSGCGELTRDLLDALRLRDGLMADRKMWGMQRKFRKMVVEEVNVIEDEQLRSEFVSHFVYEMDDSREFI